MIEAQKVESSNIDLVAYDDQVDELFVKFKNGSVYRYTDVPPNVAPDLVAAKSAGSYFDKAIRGHFKYAKLDALTNELAFALRLAAKDGEQAATEETP